MKHDLTRRSAAFAAALAVVHLACVSAPEPEAITEAGYRGALTIEPTGLAFESTVSGCQRERELSVRNGGASPVQITSIDTPNGALRFADAFPLAVAPGTTRRIVVQFAPTTAGDRSGTLSVRTDEADAAPIEIAVRASAETATRDPARMQRLSPADLVFVLDVSTTMDEMRELRSAIHALIGFVSRSGLDVRIGLTTFENDVIAHAGGTFLPPEQFFAELDSQLVDGSWIPDPELARQLLNFDLPENTLGALHRSATEFEFRADARRYLILMTDDTFLERPEVFSDGTPALHTYPEVASTLAARAIHLISVHASERGRGLSSGYQGAPSLVRSTQGNWFELADVSAGRLTLDALLADLVAGGACAASPAAGRTATAR